MSFRLSREVKIVSWSTAILWFGWGFGEPLIPVFLYQFVQGNAAAGLLKAVFDITAIIATPLIGYFADRVSLRKLMLFGIILYFLVSLNYYFAGSFFIVALVIIARFLNGFAYPAVHIAKDNYFYRYTAKSKLARAFGYFDTVTLLAWIGAVCLSLFLVPYLAIHQLFFLVAPAAVLSFGLAMFLPKTIPSIKLKRTGFNFKPYQEIIREVKNWPLKLKTLVFSAFLINLATTAFFFFIPIEVWKSGSDLKQIIVMAVFYTLPYSAGTLLGWTVDKIRINRAIIISLIGIISVFVLSVLYHDFLWRLSAFILIGIFDEVVILARRQLIADFNIRDDLLIFKTHYNFGAINSVLQETMLFGEFVGILLVGLVIDLWSLPAALISMSIVIATVLIIFLKNKVISQRNLEV